MTVIHTCACADRADKTLTGDIVIASDSAGAGGNLTVEKTLTVGTLVAGNIAVTTGQASVEQASFEGDGATTSFAVTHAQQTRLVTAVLYDSDWNQVGADMSIVDNNTIEFTFGAPPPVGAVFHAVIVQYLEPTITEETTP